MRIDEEAPGREALASGRSPSSAAATAAPSRGRSTGSLASIRPTSPPSPGQSGTSRAGAGTGPVAERPTSSGKGSWPVSIR